MSRQNDVDDVDEKEVMSEMEKSAASDTDTDDSEFDEIIANRATYQKKWMLPSYTSARLVFLRY
uniref:hypothetical protein n=1 Tax=Pseudidiomarina halophila TaxID=1449799 RepID=UPI003A96DD1D